MSVLALDDLLAELRRRRWVMHFFGPARDRLTAIGATYQWSGRADVLILRGEDDASAFRAPTFPDTDYFAPTVVAWQYHACAVWTLRAVLTLAPPGHVRAPRRVETPALGCTLPRDQRRPMSIRPT